MTPPTTQPSLAPLANSHPLAPTLHTSGGRIITNPTRQQLHAAVSDLNASDGPSRCASLTSATGHTLTLLPDNRMILTDSSQKDWRYELFMPTPARAIGLWTALADSDLETLLSEPWELQRAD